MSIKSLADYTLYSKYAQYQKEKKRRETWPEIVDRVFNMHKIKLGDKFPLIESEFAFAKEAVRKKKVLGSQRALQFGGQPLLEKQAKLYNCTVSYTDRIRFFQEAMYLLLCGCGVGFSVQTHHVAKLPTVIPRDKGVKTFVVPDSIEGWADCIGILLSSYFSEQSPYYVYDLQSELESFSGYKVEFDFSNIRPEGAPISWGGKAPGPEGLKRAVEKIEELLDKLVKKGEATLRPIDAYDIVMHASDAVLSGGIRRSATICIFSPHDEEMVNAKTGSWFIDNPQRGRSNNSALLVRNKTTAEEFSKLMESVKQFGEPGFVWAEDTEALYNPCFEKNTRIATANGLVKITDLMSGSNSVTIDKRVGKGSNLNIGRVGVELQSATPVEKTGTNVPIYKIQTAHGYEIEATAYHEFPTRDGRKQLKDLVPGDALLLQSSEGFWGSRGNYNQGLICGLICGDGVIQSQRRVAYIDVWQDDAASLEDIRFRVNSEVAKVSSLNGRDYGELHWGKKSCTEQAKHPDRLAKRLESTRLYRLLEQEISSPASLKEELPEFIWQGSRECVIGFLHGLFFADGTVVLTGKGSAATLEIQLQQSNEKLLKQVQQLLQNFGIVSRTRLLKPKHEALLPDGQGREKLYACKAQYRLEINRPNAIKLFDTIGLYGRKHDLLSQKIEERGRACYKPERYQTKITKIELSKNDDVYCLTQFATNTVIANGIVSGQCVEIGMRAYTEDGRTGWQFCNLCEINGKKASTEEEFLEACRAAAIIGTIQASYDNFSYLSSETMEIVRREALLGVSMTGIMDSPEICLNPEIQRKGAQLILDVNEEIAKTIGINPCARATCIKPAGTTSCILGTASGIHPHHASRYIRRVQANKLEFPVQHFMKYNPQAVENSVWSNNNTDLVISFLCEVPLGAKTKNQLGAIDLLKNVQLTQQNWIEAGTRHEACIAPWLRHNVSNTINVKPNEWDDVEDFIYENRKWFAGISLLPQSGDVDYPQAPFTTIMTSKEIEHEFGGGALLVSGLVVDGLAAFNNNLWAACDCALEIGEKLEDFPEPIEPVMPTKNGYDDKTYALKLLTYTEALTSYYEEAAKWKNLQLKKDWVRRFKQFAERYVDGDRKKCSHLLKHVYNYKLWLDLKREHVHVDWSEVEEIDEYSVDVSRIGAEGCLGGKCDLGDLGRAIEEQQSLKSSK